MMINDIDIGLCSNDRKLMVGLENKNHINMVVV
jgi:hypothetical protein